MVLTPETCLETAVMMLQDVDDERKEIAALALWRYAHANDAMIVAIREAGAIPLLVELLKSGSAEARRYAAGALENIADANAENKVVIREAGGIPPLLALVEGGSAYAGPISAYAGPISVSALRTLAHNNEDNAVATAVARGRVEAIVELARRGSVTVDIKQLARRGSVTVDAKLVVENAGAAVKRKAALVVATLFRDCVDSAIPYDIKTAIASYLTSPDPVRKLI